MAGCNWVSLEQHIIDEFSQTGTLDKENLLQTYRYSDEKTGQLIADIVDNGVLDESSPLTSWPENHWGAYDLQELRDLIGDKPAVGRVAVLAEEMPLLTEAAQKKVALLELVKFGQRADLAVSAVVEALGDAATRSEAISALGVMSESVVMPSIESALKPGNPVELRIGAVQAWTKFNGDLELIVDIVEEVYSSVQEGSASEDSYGLLHEALLFLDGDSEDLLFLYGLAIPELAKLKPAFLFFFESREVSLPTRVLAGKLLAKSKDVDVEYVPSYLSLAWDSSEETEIRVTALQRIGYVGQEAKSQEDSGGHSTFYILTELSKLSESDDTSERAVGKAAERAFDLVDLYR